MEGFKFFEYKYASMATKTKSSDGSENSDVIGVEYCGFIGGLKVQVIDCVNGTLGIRSGGVMLALNKTAVEDLKVILDESIPNTGLKFFDKIDQVYDVPGIAYRGVTGIVEVDFFISTKNKSASISIGGEKTIAIFPEMLDDIRTILNKNSVGLAS